MNKPPKLEGYDLLSKKVYRILKKEIIKGSFTPGSKILEFQIAQQMGISRTPVREAIRLLAAEGFIMLSPNQGAVVRTVSVENIACEVINKDGLEELENHLNKMENLLKTGDSIAYSEVDLKFHDTIVNACRNNQLIKMRKNISDQAQRYRISSLRVAKRLRESFAEHRKIFEAFKERDSNKADRMSQKHIQSALKNILKKVIEKEDNGKS